MSKQRARTPKIILIVIAICFLLILIIPYTKVEYLTWRYGNDFSRLYEQTNMFTGIDYFKVMNYSKNSASIYYVISNRSSGIMADFNYIDSKWVLDKWESIWSKSGSADGFIWPLYR